MGLRDAVVVGAGPVGCVLAIVLANRGFNVTLFEKRQDIRGLPDAAGRSINLVLTRRGLRALSRVGLDNVIQELCVPVLGRMMHAIDGELTYQPYGKDDTECNYSISRGDLNRYLLDQVEGKGVEVKFEHALEAMDAATLSFKTPSGVRSVPRDLLFGCDGAPSSVRRLLLDASECRVEMLPYGYKETTFPAQLDGGHVLAGEALHIWPRGEHMLMGLANQDSSFTGTLYLPLSGDNGFEGLDGAAAAKELFDRAYRDALEAVPGMPEEVSGNPLGRLGTVRADRWYDNRTLLVGDAAHGIVPFFGQGLNCGLEDCTWLDSNLEKFAELPDLFAAFQAARKDNADAIADMALENFVEMRDRVADSAFLRRKKRAAELERLIPDVYRSRYAMVMYSHIPYAVAKAIGVAQAELLAEHDSMALRALSVVARERLAPILRHHNIDLVAAFEEAKLT